MPGGGAATLTVGQETAGHQHGSAACLPGPTSHPSLGMQEKLTTKATVDPAAWTLGSRSHRGKAVSHTPALKLTLWAQPAAMTESSGNAVC